MLNYFIFEEEAKRILKLLEKDWSCFEELESQILRIVKDKTMFVIQALGKLLREERYDDPEIQYMWIEYTNGEPIKLSELEQKISEFCTKYGIKKERFMKWWNGKTKLVIKEEVNAERLMKLANYYALRYILQQAHTVTMVFPKMLEGKIAKEIKFRAMLIGADVEFKTNDELEAIIRIGDKTPEIMAGLAEYAKKIKAKGTYGEIEIENVPISGELEWEEYDSQVERTIAQILTSMGAKVRREPRVIMREGTMFIPYFIVKYEGRNVFLEIVGYWRKNYLINKEMKIRKAIEKGIRIIIVANRKNADAFEHIGVPIITYEKPEDLEEVSKKIIMILQEL